VSKPAMHGLWVPMITWIAASAAQLPVKTYTTADGLARNTITCIVQDPRGFLWFCTSEGLSRFDGYTFTNYGTEHGLPNRVVTSLLIGRHGAYWVGTYAGLFRFDPNSSLPQKFEAVPLGAGAYAQQVNSVLEDGSGSLWVGTEAGLYRLEGGKAAWELVDVGIPADATGGHEVQALLMDRRGVLWIGGGHSLYVRVPDGRTTRHQDRQLSRGTIVTLCEDREGRIWAGDHEAVYQLNPNAGPEDPIVTRTYTVKDGLPGNRIVALLESSDGRFWVGGFGGLGEYVPTADKFESYTITQGLSDQDIHSLAEDSEGNLWVGTASAGAMKIARRGFTSYTQTDGLSNVGIASIFVDQAGELCASGGQKGAFDCFNGRRFASIRPKYPETIHYFGWGWSQIAFQDHAGEWWIPTGQGLCRFGRTSRAEQLAGRAPKAVYTTRDGLAGNDIFRLFEDSRGDIWIVNIVDSTGDVLTRWERATGSFHVCTAADGLPKGNGPTAFAEDRSGQLWMGLYNGGLARFRNGHFTLYNETDGLPAGMIRALHQDHTGRLWIASDHGGLGRIDNPSEAKPHFAKYTTADGLSNDSVLCLTEDQWGRIYACTGHGVDRLDPATGRIKHYTTADGLARGEQGIAGRDRESALWFGSLAGLSRLVPVLEEPVSPPPVHIMGLQVRGVSRPLAEFGQSTVSGLVFQPNENQLRLDFVGLGFAPGERLRYQYRLEGADREWSPPTEQRTINYASLSPGSYTFQVRALNVEGAVSPQPASVTFTILAPVWQRWWFLSAAGIALGLLIYCLCRYRLAQLLAVERIRTRIATDLHDDIGSSLSQVAILSEVVRRRIGESDPEVNGPLSRIGVLSRELVDSMSDIVWAINPAKDNLYFLTQRMREFANDVFMARDIQFEFRALDRDYEFGIGAEVRRQVFLIFKECVHNVVRHANCTHVEIEIRLEGEGLVVLVRDNGAGFEPLAAVNGHGLASMRDRAQRLGGRFGVAANGHGTEVTLEVPLAKTGLSAGPRQSPHLNRWGKPPRF
jgi:ligand-binding sensor domain-containing protein/signal transduction histidine kinase